MMSSSESRERLRPSGLLRLLLLAGGHRRSLLGERDRPSPALTPSDSHECLVAHMEERVSRGQGSMGRCSAMCRGGVVAVRGAVRAIAGFATFGHAHIRGLGTPGPLFVARPLSKVECARRGGCSGWNALGLTETGLVGLQVIILS